METITTKTPLRITFAGGGTDVKWFYEKHGGDCVNATINKYVTVTVKDNPGYPRSLHSDTVRAAVELIGVRDVQVEIKKDISVHGLGTSSAICVGLLKALYFWESLKGLEMKSIKRAELAEKAYHLERELLGRPGGKQDHYAAAYGGLNFFEFAPDGQVFDTTLPASPPEEFFKDLPEYLLLMDLNQPRFGRTSDSPHDDLDVDSLITTSSLIFPCLEALEHQMLRFLACILSAGWEIKKKSHPSITNETIDAIYDKALSAGAWGGKLMGGGGGGCFLFICPPEARENVKSVLDTCTHIPFEFESKGSHIVKHL